MAGSHSESGSEFQAVGPATEKAKSAATKARNIQFAKKLCNQ